MKEIKESWMIDRSDNVIFVIIWFHIYGKLLDIYLEKDFGHVKSFKPLYIQLG
jgi:hypothetical protein